MGATIAFEMAKILEKSFKSIELVLIDKSVSNPRIQEGDKLRERDALAAELKKWDVENDFDSEHISDFLIHMMDMLGNYSTNGMIQSNITALESKGNATRANMERWRAYTTGTTIVEFIDGTHWEAISDQHYPRYKAVLGKSLLSK
jgi:thioesterase domain-containing protein